MARSSREQEAVLSGDESDGNTTADAATLIPTVAVEDRRLSVTSNGPRLRRIASNGSAVSLSNSFRNPSRSYFHRSQHATNSSTDTNQHTSEEVRDQTAELGSIALSSSVRSSSPGLRLNLSSIQSLDGSIAGASDGEAAQAATDDSFQAIEEVSEPPTPSPHHSSQSSLSARPSALTELLRNSPPKEDRSTSQVHNETRILSLGNEESLGPNRKQSQRPEPSPLTEQSKLAHDRSHFYNKYGTVNGVLADLERQQHKEEPRFSFQKVFNKSNKGFRTHMQRIASPKNWDKKALRHFLTVKLGQCLSAVFIGVLLNILDALSYGTILFPRSEPFQDMEADGILLFYVSTVISQLVFSCGGSIFKGGVGSEMIEVVPFFHKMAFRIVDRVGLENPNVVISTTLVSYALSSVLTGLVFFSMGKFHLGSLIGFFPRHILVGCIGGVGWFLVATGIEVSARLAGSLQYTLHDLAHLFNGDVAPMWLIPFVLSLILLALKRRFVDNSFLVPGFILATLAAFYFFVTALDALTLEKLRDFGWIFDRPPSEVSVFDVYSYYRWGWIDWGSVASTFDIMLALTFFGILHVPINVPALGMATQEDNVDIDQELKAHGLSNTLSGCVGSIQNYLVYTNSVLFISSGGNSRLAGILLAFATLLVASFGIGMIGFIPRLAVGTLIFLLGFDLMMEALYDTFGKMTRLEYATIIAIMITMGTWDFVTGILVGIILACVNFVVQTSQKSAVRATYTGQVARSTVRRHPDLNRYLRQVGSQIEMVKLAGFLFFGTIVDVESKIRDLLTEESFDNRQIQFLILDFSHVTGIDFSAAEAFTRINRILSTRRVRMVLSGLVDGSEIKNSLKNNGLWETENPAEIVDDLNSALEFCENEFIEIFNAQERILMRERPGSSRLNIPRAPSHSFSAAENIVNSPRQRHLAAAATTTINSPAVASGQGWDAFKPPLPILLQTFKDVSSEREDFWFRAAPYFERQEYAKGTVLYKPGEISELFIVLAEGLLLVEDDYQQGRHSERITPATTCGELPFFSTSRRTATVTAEKDVVAWELSREKLNALQDQHPEIVNELQRIALALTIERMEANMSHVLVRAG